MPTVFMLVMASGFGQSPPAASGLTFTAPPAWHSRPAASTMRVAEFVVPKAPGDPEDAEVILYFFGGQSGSVDANIDRWIGQMQEPAGSARCRSPMARR